MSHRGRAQLSSSKPDNWLCNVKNKSQYYTAFTVNYTIGVQEDPITPNGIDTTASGESQEHTHHTRVCDVRATCRERRPKIPTRNVTFFLEEHGAQSTELVSDELCFVGRFSNYIKISAK